MARPPTHLRPAAAPGACALAVACLVVAATAPAAPRPSPAPLADRRQVCVRGNCFDAEVAVTAEERSTGLMHRTFLAADRGMLFVFPEEGLHAFWMKNTLIELDIVFVSAAGRVVSVAARAQPCRAEPCAHYAPAAPAAYVLELAGGTAQRLGVAPGDPVTFGPAISAPPPASGTR